MDQGQLSLAGPLDGISRLSNSNTLFPAKLLAPLLFRHLVMGMQTCLVRKRCVNCAWGCRRTGAASELRLSRGQYRIICLDTRSPLCLSAQYTTGRTYRTAITDI